MPPIAKYSKEQIRDVAYAIVQSGGVNALTSRSLAEKLGVSTRPIFTAFRNMDDVLASITQLAAQDMDLAISRPLRTAFSFTELGRNLVRFVRENTNIYQLLFLYPSNVFTTFEKLINLIPETYTLSCALLTLDKAETPESADKIFKHFWLFSLGICNLIVNNNMQFSDEELNDLFLSEYKALTAYSSAVATDTLTGTDVRRTYHSLSWNNE